MVKMANVIFDEHYYRALMEKNGYDPIDFGRINFNLGELTEFGLNRRWICHNQGDNFANGVSGLEKSIVTTGFGMSGDPHAGTLSQMFGAIALQRAGIPVQIVLGDLDAFNGKSKDFAYTLEMADMFREFLLGIGFVQKNGSILRNQIDATDTALTAVIAANVMEDEMFRTANEDLHSFYQKRGKVSDELDEVLRSQSLRFGKAYARTPGFLKPIMKFIAEKLYLPNMSYPRRVSLNLMTADFIDLKRTNGFGNVMVMLGIDEHQYVRFSQETVKRLNEREVISGLNLGAIYSGIIPGFNGYPKMSKSFPESGIHVGMRKKEIVDRIVKEEGTYKHAHENVVFQLIARASLFSDNEVEQAYEACVAGGRPWQKWKRTYADFFVSVAEKWPGENSKVRYSYDRINFHTFLPKHKVNKMMMALKEGIQYLEKERELNVHTDIKRMDGHDYIEAIEIESLDGILSFSAYYEPSHWGQVGPEGDCINVYLDFKSHNIALRHEYDSIVKFLKNYDR